MKKQACKNIFLTLIIIVGGLSSYAQQKASDRSFNSEIKKLKQIQESRKKMLQQTQQTGVNNQTQATTTQENKTKQPATKPSLQPMTIPARPKKQ